MFDVAAFWAVFTLPTSSCDEREVRGGRANGAFFIASISALSRLGMRRYPDEENDNSKQGEESDYFDVHMRSCGLLSRWWFCE